MCESLPSGQGTANETFLSRPDRTPADAGSCRWAFFAGPFRYHSDRPILGLVAGDADRRRSRRALSLGDLEGRSMKLADLPRGSLFALMLIIVGALLFLDNVGILHIQDIRAYWPIFIVLFGVQILHRGRSRIA